jgi:acyl-coenzyme A thioesterase PaaI-like protein
MTDPDNLEYFSLPASGKPLTELFPSLHWAHEYITSPSFTSQPRTRPILSNHPADGLCQLLLHRENGIKHWYELKRSRNIDLETLSDQDVLGVALLDLGGVDLTSVHANRVHGGAIFTIMDDAMGAVVNGPLRKAVVAAAAPSPEATLDWSKVFLTTEMTITYLRPLKTPGSCGMKTFCLAAGGKGIRVRAVMVDERGKHVAVAESTWRSVESQRARM